MSTGLVRSRVLGAARRRALGAALAMAAVVTAAGLGQAGPAEAGDTQHGRVVFVDDGDTIDVNVAHDGMRAPQRVRFIGIQAMELKHYNRDLSKISGECWAPRATRVLHRLVFHKRVRLTSRTGEARPGRAGMRIRRYVSVKRDGVWQDVGGLLVDAGLVLAEVSHNEYGRNLDYAKRAEQAALAARGLYGQSTRCGAGPSQDQPLRVSINYDAEGKDFQNINGEWVDVENLGTAPVSLNGWWLRDTSNRGYQGRGYEFPIGTTVQPGSQVRVHVGSGTDTATSLHWGWTRPAFVNPTDGPRWMGDGAFLFDRDGDLRAWQMYPCRSTC